MAPGPLRVRPAGWQMDSSPPPASSTKLAEPVTGQQARPRRPPSAMRKVPFTTRALVRERTPPLRMVTLLKLPPASIIGVLTTRSGSVTVKALVELAVPAGVVTLIRPVLAPAGTVAVRLVAEFTVKLLAAAPLKATVVAPLRPVPVRVTTVPTGPLAGEKPVMAGGATQAAVRVKLPVLPLKPATYTR